MYAVNFMLKNNISWFMKNFVNRQNQDLKVFKCLKKLFHDIKFMIKKSLYKSLRNCKTHSDQLTFYH